MINESYAYKLCLECVIKPSAGYTVANNFRALSSAEAQRVFFFRVDPLSNVSAGTELQATAESAGASARYHTQDGRHPGETIFSELLSGVA